MKKKFKIKRGTVYIVGAGPGAFDLITLRGKHLLEEATVVIFTGSLVPGSLLEHCKNDPEICDSKGMSLEEILSKMVVSARKGEIVVRLHTGDPSIFGAIQEQINILKKEKIPFEIVPGISSFQGAAAELKTELTIPGVTQTVIISRAEGRTPVPGKENLKELARHRATIVLFLSAGIAEKVEKDLLTAYPVSEPIAIVYRVSWDDQKIIRGKLKNLVTLIKKNRIKKHALIVIGPALKNKHTLSKLYDKNFSHQYRKRPACCRQGQMGR